MEVDTEKWGCTEVSRYRKKGLKNELNEIVCFSDCGPLELYERQALTGFQTLAQQSELTFEYVDRQIESTANISKKVITD